jgi:predicted DNA-binding ribbon-helix-helix protein
MTHLKPRNIVVGNRRTTVRLESRYWEELQTISRRTGRSIRDICTSLDQTRTGTLASALRLFVLAHFAWLHELRRSPLDLLPDHLFDRPNWDESR